MLPPEELKKVCRDLGLTESELHAAMNAAMEAHRHGADSPFCRDDIEFIRKAGLSESQQAVAFVAFGFIQGSEMMKAAAMHYVQEAQRLSLRAVSGVADLLERAEKEGVLPKRKEAS